MTVRYRLHPHGKMVFDANKLIFEHEWNDLWFDYRAFRDNWPYTTPAAATIRISSKEKIVRTASLKEKLFQGKNKFIEEEYIRYSYYPVYIICDGKEYYEPFTKTQFEFHGYISNGLSISQPGASITIPGVDKEVWHAHVTYCYEGDGAGYIGNCPALSENEAKEVFSLLKNNEQYRLAILAYFDALRKESIKLRKNRISTNPPQYDTNFKDFIQKL